MNKKFRPEEALDFGITFTVDESLDKRPKGSRVPESVRLVRETLRNLTSWPPELDIYFKKLKAATS